MSKTHFRWMIILLFFILNCVSYIDRSAMAYAVKTIMADLHLNFTAMGTILGSFGIGYLITTLLGGIVVDRYGARVTITVFSLLWALAMASTGLAMGFISAYMARFALGLGEGPNFPAVARTVSDWLPPVERAKALANALVGVPVALAIGAPLVTFLLVTFDWRMTFFVLAAALLLWWPFWWIFYRNKPQQSPRVNAAELAHIQQPSSAPAAIKKSTVNWRFFLSNPTLLSNNWAFFVFGYAMYFFMTWLPDFLEKSYALNVKQVGLFAFLPWALGALFLWTTGYLSDRIFLKTKKLRYARSYPILLGQLCSLLALLPLLYWHNLTLALVSITLAVAFSLSNNTTFYATNVDVARAYAGSSLGLMNAGFAIAGFLAPALTGWLVQTTGNFHYAFLLIILLTLSSVIAVYFFHQPDRDGGE